MARRTWIRLLTSGTWHRLARVERDVQGLYVVLWARCGLSMRPHQALEQGWAPRLGRCEGCEGKR